LRKLLKYGQGLDMIDENGGWIYGMGRGFIKWNGVLA